MYIDISSLGLSINLTISQFLKTWFMNKKNYAVELRIVMYIL